MIAYEERLAINRSAGVPPAIREQDNFHMQPTTIENHILDQQHKYPDATGELTNLLYDIALAGKFIASKVIMAGLTGVLGKEGVENVQGEEVMRMDRFANSMITQLTEHTGRLA